MSEKRMGQAMASTHPAQCHGVGLVLSREKEPRKKQRVREAPVPEEWEVQGP